MLIRCTIERPQGFSEHTIEGKAYRFAPMPGVEGHVADVTDKGHIARFLAVPSSFEIHDAELSPAPAAEAAQPAPDPEPRTVAAPVGGHGGDEDSERAALLARYAELNGRAAPPTIKIETLRAKVAELEDEKAKAE